MQKLQRNVQKSVMLEQIVGFLIKGIASLTFSLWLLASDLKVLNNTQDSKSEKWT